MINSVFIHNPNNFFYFLCKEIFNGLSKNFKVLVKDRVAI